MSSFWKGKRVCVAGGSGFIGSHTVERLLAAGAIVRYSRRSKGFDEFELAVAGRAQPVACDFRDPAQCHNFLKDQDVCMYLAAAVGGIQFNIDHPASVFRDNLLPFMTVLEAAREARTPRFLITSSACVYPRHCLIPTPESEALRDLPEPTNVGYGMSKRVEEFLGAQYAKQYGMSIAIARPYNAYGPRDNFGPDKSHVIPALIRRIFAEHENPISVWGSGNQSRSFLYVDDFARGLLEVAEHYAVAEPVNIGNAEEVTIAQLIAMLAAIHREKTGSELRWHFDTTKPEGQPRRACDTTKALAAFNYRTEVPFETGLRRTVDWFLANQSEALAR
jgi:GDP-L-fucose synthase